MARVRALDNDGDYSFGQSSANFLVNSAEMVAQNVETRLLLMQGEWFLDVTTGTPYATQILGPGAQVKPLYDLAIQGRILSTAGVLSITQYQSTLDPSTRRLNVSATISTIYGQTGISVNLF